MLLLSSFLYYLSFTYFHHRTIRNVLLLFFISLDNKTDIFNWFHPIFKPYLITSQYKNPIPVNSHLTSGIFYCPLNFFTHHIDSIILCPLNKTNKCQNTHRYSHIFTNPSNVIYSSCTGKCSQLASSFFLLKNISYFLPGRSATDKFLSHVFIWDNIQLWFYKFKSIDMKF